MKTGYENLPDIEELEKRARAHGFPCRIQAVDTRGTSYSRKFDDDRALIEQIADLRLKILSFDWIGRQFRITVGPPLTMAA